MGLFRKSKTKGEEEQEEIYAKRYNVVPMEVVVRDLNRKDERLTDPTNDKIPHSLRYRTNKLWDDVHRHNPLKYDVHVKIRPGRGENGVIHPDSLESLARLRALRSTGKKEVGIIHK